MGTMLEQLKQMMGESQQQQDTPAEPKEGKAGQQAGDGSQGGTTDKNSDPLTKGGGDGGNRRLDKKSGITPSELPDEYRKIIDAYNKANKVR